MLVLLKRWRRFEMLLHVARDCGNSRDAVVALSNPANSAATSRVKPPRETLLVAHLACAYKQAQRTYRHNASLSTRTTLNINLMSLSLETLISSPNYQPQVSST